MTDDKNKTRKIRVGFFTGTERLTNPKGHIFSAKAAFEKLHAANNGKLPLTYTIDKLGKGLKVVLMEKDELSKTFFGYVSWRRHSLLPFIEDETGLERIIPLGDTDSVVERTYFIYYYKSDLLALTLNHLGPKVNDFSFALYQQGGLENIRFEAIWKEEDVKDLLETGNVLRSVDLTIAAPRNFNQANYNFENNLTKDIVNMVVGMGGTYLKLNLRGRARAKKDGFSYLSGKVGDAVKELIELFPLGAGGLKIKKADVTEPSDSKPKSLLGQVLIGKKTINVIGGYPTESDIRMAMIAAKIDNGNYLAQYELPDTE